MYKSVLAVVVSLMLLGGPAFAESLDPAEAPIGSDTLVLAVDAGATPEEAVVSVLKKVLMCPSIVNCAEVVTAAISLYPENARGIVTAAIIAAPACETEIIQGAIIAGLDPGLVSQATAAGRRPPSPFSPPEFGPECTGCGGSPVSES